MAAIFADYQRIQQQLVEAGLDPAPREGQVLAAAAQGDEARLGALLARRLKGEPLAYVVGFQPFWSRDWAVGPAVLIPRPDSEVLVQAVLDVLPKARQARVAEVGVGSGALLGSVLLERPEVRGVATDLMADALHMARLNLEAAGVLNRVMLQQADLMAGVEGPFDVILSNPPYIGPEAYAALESGVRDWEPQAALLATEDGLALYAPLAQQAWERLASGGWLMVEMGFDQAAAVREIFVAQGYGAVRVLPDLAGRDRVVVGQK